MFSKNEGKLPNALEAFLIFTRPQDLLELTGKKQLQSAD
jgi:hypothetical protein